MTMRYLQRSIGNATLLVVIVLWAIGCGSASIDNQLVNANVIHNANGSPRQLDTESRRTILEVWQELDGSVPIRGKSLYWRMYDDGEVEFDCVTRKLSDSANGPISYSTKKVPPTKISDESFATIKSLVMELSGEKGLKKEFSPVGLSLDTSVKLSFSLTESDGSTKSIIVNDSDLDLLNPKFASVFPKSLVDLVKEIHSERLRLAPDQHGAN